jgi:hypothetical protein
METAKAICLWRRTDVEFRGPKSKAVPPTTRREFLRKAAAGVVLLPTPRFSHAAVE